MFEPKNDGIDHINIYTKGATQLGKKLTNLYSHYSKIKLDLGDYLTLEGYWYSLKINSLKTSINDYSVELEQLKNLNGFKAKSLGSSIMKELLNKQTISEDDYINEEFKTQFKKAILTKIETIPNLKLNLISSSLPLTHYYYYGTIENPKIIELPKHQWMIDYISELRNTLK